MKTMKFRRELSELILSGEKNVTWRLFDDKNISQGDVVSMIIWESKEEFAKAKILSVVEKKFFELTPEDYVGQEDFGSEQGMYETISKYYNKKIDKNTSLKVIRFELLK